MLASVFAVSLCLVPQLTTRPHHAAVPAAARRLSAPTQAALTEEEISRETERRRLAAEGKGEVAEASAAALGDKMAQWDATEEEQRAKTLGGNLPFVGMPGKPGRVTRKDQPTKMDGFDIGMTASAVILVPLTLAVLQCVERAVLIVPHPPQGRSMAACALSTLRRPPSRQAVAPCAIPHVCITQVLAFPFFIGGIDISSVGPPPTQ